MCPQGVDMPSLSTPPSPSSVSTLGPEADSAPTSSESPGSSGSSGSLASSGFSAFRSSFMAAILIAALVGLALTGALLARSSTLANGAAPTHAAAPSNAAAPSASLAQRRHTAGPAHPRSASTVLVDGIDMHERGSVCPPCGHKVFGSGRSDRAAVDRMSGLHDHRPPLCPDEFGQRPVAQPHPDVRCDFRACRADLGSGRPTPESIVGVRRGT